MTIILYGTSLILDNFEIALRDAGHQNVLRLSSVHLPPCSAGLEPGTIIYDPYRVSAADLFQLFTDYAGWQMIGITESGDGWQVSGVELSSISPLTIAEGSFGINRRELEPMQPP